MKMRIAAGAAMMLLAIATPAAAATDDSGALPEPAPRAAPTYGRTLPPVGFVGFCGRHPEACAARGTATPRPQLSGRQWDLVTRINAYVNKQVKPASDEDIYGEAEHWDYPVSRGDCEDYALLKQRYLEAMGLPRSALLLTVVLDDQQEGHAVLTLATSEGDFLLDNRRDGLQRWSDSSYTFLKRQSARDPRDWLALAPGPRTADGPVALRSIRTSPKQ